MRTAFLTTRRSSPGHTRGAGSGPRPASGFTFVEVMIAMIILALLAIGGGAFLSYSRTHVDIQRNKRAALEEANKRLEELRASGYDATKPTNNNYVVVYLQKSGNAWNRRSSDPGETVSINGQTMPIVTTVQFVDVDGGSASYDYTLFAVQVGFRAGSTNRVHLWSYNSP